MPKTKERKMQLISRRYLKKYRYLDWKMKLSEINHMFKLKRKVSYSINKYHKFIILRVIKWVREFINTLYFPTWKGNLNQLNILFWMPICVNTLTGFFNAEGTVEIAIFWNLSKHFKLQNFFCEGRSISFLYREV